ncbi:hypothetical protein LIER_42257 [Lithospermum erythrorhizon]|uniref:Integrase catalytic domain-containing protein n=1 Tax=Lithospermum erythrorhizon TaxID=34254 RepID=A0AAV3RN86_LITER
MFHASLITFQADEGGEFHKLEPFFKDNGILYRYSCPNTPQQNATAKRKHRHIVDKMRCLLFQSMLPPVFWVEVINNAVYIINKLLSPSLNNNSPHQLLYHKTPTYNLLKVFGSLCYPNLVKNGSKKFDPRSLPHIFLGVSTIHKGYRCFNTQTRKPSSSSIFPVNFKFHDPSSYTSNLPVPSPSTSLCTLSSILLPVHIPTSISSSPSHHSIVLSPSQTPLPASTSPPYLYT